MGTGCSHYTQHVARRTEGSGFCPVTGNVRSDQTMTVIISWVFFFSNKRKPNNLSKERCKRSASFLPTSQLNLVTRSDFCSQDSNISQRREKEGRIQKEIRNINKALPTVSRANVNISGRRQHKESC